MSAETEVVDTDPWAPGWDRDENVPTSGRSDDEAPATKHLRDRLLSLDDLARMPPVLPLVDGLIYRGTLAQLAGPPGSYKSFIAVGIACSVALGMPWEGHAVPHSGHVLYVVPEGASGIRARVLAWCDLPGVDPRDLRGRLQFLPEPIYLGNSLNVAQAIEVTSLDNTSALVVLDTRARCTTGLEENSSTEQGRAIDAAERIGRGDGAAVLAVHHSGRSGDHGRGSNAWDGAIWSDLRITGEDLRCRIHCEKHKDVPDKCDHHYRLVPHEVPEQLMPGCTLQQRSTLVAVQMSHLDELAGDRRSTRTVLDIVRKTAGDDGLTRAQIATFAEEHKLGRSTVYEAVNVLVNVAALRNVGTLKRARFVANGDQPTLGEEQ
jgi:hypothetical protein